MALTLVAPACITQHSHFQLDEVSDSRAVAPERPFSHDMAEQDVSHQDWRELRRYRPRDPAHVR